MLKAKLLADLSAVFSALIKLGSSHVIMEQAEAGLADGPRISGRLAVSTSSHRGWRAPTCGN